MRCKYNKRIDMSMSRKVTSKTYSYFTFYSQSFSVAEIGDVFMMNKLLSNTPYHIWSITCLRLHIRHLSAQQIRLSFLEYFKEHDHTYVPSSSVIPEDDNSVAFVSAGMNQV